MRVSYTNIALGCSMVGAIIISFWSPPFGLLVNNIALMVLVMEIRKMELRRVNTDEQHKLALKEAGAAITEALRVVFSGLKRESAIVSKQGTAITDHTRRIHRAEQIIQKMASKHNIQIVQEQAKDKAAPRRPVVSEDEDEN